MMKFYIMHSKILLHKFQDTKIKKILSIDFREGKVANTQRTGNQNGNNLRHGKQVDNGNSTFKYLRETYL